MAAARQEVALVGEDLDTHIFNTFFHARMFLYVMYLFSRRGQIERTSSLGSAAQILKGAAAYLHAVVGSDLDQVLDELRRVLKVDVGCGEKQEIHSLRRSRL